MTKYRTLYVKEPTVMAAGAAGVAAAAVGTAPVPALRDIFPMTHHVECVAILEPAEKGR